MDGKICERKMNGKLKVFGEIWKNFKTQRNWTEEIKIVFACIGDLAIE